MSRPLIPAPESLRTALASLDQHLAQCNRQVVCKRLESNGFPHLVQALMTVNPNGDEPLVRAFVKCFLAMTEDVREEDDHPTWDAKMAEQALNHVKASVSNQLRSAISEHAKNPLVFTDIDLNVPNSACGEITTWLRKRGFDATTAPHSKKVHVSLVSAADPDDPRVDAATEIE